MGTWTRLPINDGSNDLWRVILASGRLRQDLEFESSLDYIVGLRLAWAT
jgi:hypothetical protein